MNTFSSKSNATRAARAAGLDVNSLIFSEADGRWSFAAPAPIVNPEPAAPAPKKRGGVSKADMLVALALSPEGVTNARLREVSGWTKLGGFFDAAKRAGLALHRCREAGDTRWFAVLPRGKAAAYLQDEDGTWQRFGLFGDAAEATVAAIVAAPDGTSVSVQTGKNGEVYLFAAGDR